MRATASISEPRVPTGMEELDRVLGGGQARNDIAAPVVSKHIGDGDLHRLLQEQLNGGSWVTIQTGSATSKALSGKGNGSYGYQAQACNAGGCGPWSSIGTTTVLLPPTAPENLSASIASSLWGIA